MRRRLLATLLALCMALTLLPVNALAAKSDTDIPYAVTGGNIYFDEATGTITGCDDSVTGAEIPSTINGAAVTSIGERAFSNCYSLTSVTIPDGVTRIGDSAFDGCSSLTSITIPNSVTSIGGEAFLNCSGLTRISVDLENPNYASEDGVLFDKQKRILIWYPAGKSTSTYVIPDGVTSIGERAFCLCLSLTSVTIPDGVTSIGNGAFWDCSSLTSITIPASVTSIGDYVFSQCSGLTSITFPNSVTSIGDYAFSQCSGLTSITFPNSVTSIGDYAFSQCSGLTSITIPDSVTSIGDFAFDQCSGLMSITLPNSVANIGTAAFRCCSNLADITVDPDNQAYTALDGMLFSKDKSSIIFCLNGKSGAITIPDSVTSIGDFAFYGCSSLTSITIPDSVTSIGDYAFGSCSRLTSITIPNSVTRIERGAFSGCTGLTSITIPDSITTIESYLFHFVYANSSLTSITIPSSVTTIEISAFLNCTALTDAYYTGSRTQWNAIEKQDGNQCLLDANIHFGCSDIFYDANGGLGTMDSDIVEKDISFTLPICGFTAPIGKEFKAWQIDGQEYAPGSTYTVIDDITIVAVWQDKTDDPSIPKAYTVTVNGGMGGGDYEIGEDVTITAIVPEGMQFRFWTVEEGDVILDDPYSEMTSFTMPASDVTVTATYEDIATPPDPSQTYTVAVNGGTGGGRYEAGERVTITAIVPEGQEFTGWIVEQGDVTLADPYSEVTTFTMPASNVTVTVTYEDIATPPVPSTYTVTFDPNGGTGTMDDEQVSAGGIFIFPVCGFTAPAGREFKAWRVGGQEYAPGDTCTVTGDMTVTAVWKAIIPDGYTLTGTITGHKGVTYTSVTAQLAGLNGSVYSAEVGEGVTNKTGKTDYSYSVTAPAGQYNLEVEARTDAGGVVNRTALVKLTGSGQTKDVNLPNGQAKAAVKNNGGKAALVGGLDELVIDADGEIRGEVALTIDDVDKSSPGAAAIQGAASGQTLEFMDISIIRSENEVETAVTDTGDVIIQIVLTFDSTGKRDIAVYRYHDGSVDTLTTQVSGDGEKIEVDDDSLTIYAKKFSVYAIGYTISDADPAPAAPSNPTTPSQPGSSSSSSSSSSKNLYSISIPADITGGTVSASRKSAAKGSTVALTVTADEGYELASLTAMDSKGNALELTDKGDGKYTFTMPGSAVTVSAVFRLMEQQPAVPTAPDWVNPFTDVSTSAWYYDTVKFVNENGLMNGLSSIVFAPDANLSRAELAQILYNKEGKPAVGGGSAFTDVDAGAWYADAVTWAAANHIVGGYGNGLFGPDDNITREQLAVMLWRYAGEPMSAREISFSDADQISGFAQAAIRWAVENGILNGKGNNILDPKGFATRAEAAQMLKNYLDN